MGWREGGEGGFERFVSDLYDMVGVGTVHSSLPLSRLLFCLFVLRFSHHSSFSPIIILHASHMVR